MQEKTKQILVLILLVSIVIGFVVPGIVLNGSDGNGQEDFKEPMKEQKLCQSEQNCWLVCREKPKAVPCINNLCESTKCEEFSAFGEAEEVQKTAKLKILINGKEKELPISSAQKSSFVSFGEKGTITTHAKNVPLGYVVEMLGMQFTKDCLVTEAKESFCNGEGKELILTVNGIGNYFFDGHVVENEEEIVMEYK